jgi:plasmid stability protein
MPPLSLNLPSELKAKAETRAAEAGHGSVEQYIESLIRADVESPDDPGAPPALSVRAADQVEALVTEGLASGPGRVVSDDEWAEKRSRLLQRHSAGDVA